MARPCCEQDATPADKRGGLHEAEDREITILLAGNPNAGKTTLFNRLTGARQRTGNWPGVTVERREGLYEDEHGRIRVIDLPGTYSIIPVPGSDEALDEAVARDAVAAGDYDVIVDVLDAANLERNLYLTAQLAEARRPMVVALNMMDEAARRGIMIEPAALEEMLGVPVIPVVARHGEGVEELVQAIRKAAREHAVPQAQAPWPQEVRKAIDQLRPLLQEESHAHGADARWLAIRLLEGDAAALDIAPVAAQSLASKARAHIMKTLKEVPDLVLADARYELAHQLAQAATGRRIGELEEQTAAPDEVMQQSVAGRASGGFGAWFDKLALHGLFGPLIFLLAMYLLFMLTINVGGAFVDFFDIAAGALFVDGARVLLSSIGAPAWLIAVLADGIGAGLQTVATFIPIIAMLYLLLSLLEDSGYMARAAFLTDRWMRRIGLPGRAFVPLIVGFGCNVPGIMAARTLGNPRQRIATILMTPFMSCGARLAVFALFAAAFFPSHGQNLVFLLYLVGIAAAILTGLLTRRFLLAEPGEGLPFMMELPPYRLPRISDVLLYAWMRLKGFIVGAGKVIVVVVALLGTLNAMGTDGSFGAQDSEKSVLSAIGKQITPVFAPIGIREDNWPATVGLITGVFAKEVVVGTLNALYAELARQERPAGAQGEAQEDAGFDLFSQLGEAFATIPANLKNVASSLFDPLGLSAVGDAAQVAEEQEVSAATFGEMVKRFGGQIGAFAYMLFVLLYFPCAATFGAIAREAGMRWALFSAAWSTWLGWFAASGFYQAATFARHPAFSALWLAGLAAGMVMIVLFIRWLGRRGVLIAETQPAAAQ